MLHLGLQNTSLVLTKGVYLLISKPHSILAVANLIAHNNLKFFEK